MSTGFTFGTNPASFGTPSLQNQGSFGFTGTTQPTTGFQFGTPSTSNLFGTGLSFNTPTSASTTSSGQILTSTAPPPTFSFGTPTLTALNSSTPVASCGLFNNATTTTSGFSFGTSANKASTLGSTVVTNPIGSISITFGLGENKESAVTSNNFNPTTVSSAVVGLGGLASSQAKTGTTVTTQKEVSPKEQPLPNEILQTVDQFKEMIKQQKIYSSDIARCSARDFRKVEQEIDLLNNLLNDVESQLQKNRHLAEKLKYDTAKCLHNVEIAQRTQDTPPGLQYENTAPLRYFLNLADLFEREMQTLKIQIESAEKYVKNHRNPDILTPQDLALGMRRLHETFVALAGRLQSVHGQVETQKENFLNMRRQICIDSLNPFDKLDKAETLNNLKNVLIYSPPKVATGPTPFSNFTLSNGNSLAHRHQLPIRHSGTSTYSIPLGLELCNPLNTTVLNMPFGQTSLGISSTNFQLQKPPTGNKRGKQ